MRHNKETYDVKGKTRRLEAISISNHLRLPVFTNDLGTDSQAVILLQALTDQTIVNDMLMSLMMETVLKSTRTAFHIEIIRDEEDVQVNIFSLLGLEDSVISNRKQTDVHMVHSGSRDDLAETILAHMHNISSVRFFRKLNISMDTVDGEEYRIEITIYDKNNLVHRKINSRFFMEDLVMAYESTH